VSILELAGIPDTLPYCPVKEAEIILEFPVLPILPEPAEVTTQQPFSSRWWQYRVCGIDQLMAR
jgi:hypothetical protein